MRVFRGFENLPQFKGAVATLGSFDGVHRGHLSLLDSVKELAKETEGESVVLTFEPHPRVVLGRAEGLRLLTSTDEKIKILEDYGVDNLIIIPFDKIFSRLSHRDFLKQYLVDVLNIATLVVGYNHHMGRGSEGGYDSFLQMSNDFGFQVHRVNEWRDSENANVSSTVVRYLLSRGDIERTMELLSRPYIIMGQVDSDGRVWVSEPLKLIPAVGKYYVLINDIKSQIVIDKDGIIWCEELGQQVTIELLGRIE